MAAHAQTSSEGSSILKSRDLHAQLDAGGLSAASVGAAEINLASSNFVTQEFIDWTLGLRRNALEIIQTLILGGPAPADQPQNGSQELQDEDSCDDVISEIATYRVSMVSAESDGFSMTDDDQNQAHRLPCVLSVHKSRPWISIDALQINIWGNTIRLTIPYPIELRKLRIGYNLDLRGNCVVNIFGTNTLKLRAPVSVALDGSNICKIHKVKLKGLDLTAFPTLVLTAYNLINAGLNRFRRQTGMANLSGGSIPDFSVEEVEIEHIIVRLSTTFTVSAKTTRFLKDVTLTITSIRALQSMPEPQLHHLACLHAHVSDIRWTFQSRDALAKSRIGVNVFALHLVPALLGPCLQPFILAWILGLSVLKGMIRKQNQITSSSPALQSVTSRDSIDFELPSISCQVTSFSLHLQETAFLTTKTSNKKRNLSRRLWLLELDNSLISTGLDLAQSMKAIKSSLQPNKIDWGIELTLLALIESDLVTAIPWHRTSSATIPQVAGTSTSPAIGSAPVSPQIAYNNGPATYGFTFEASDVNLLRENSGTISDELLIETTSTPMIILRVVDLNLKSRGSSTSLGRIDFEAIYTKSKSSLTVHKLLANLSRCQTLRLADLVQKTVNMLTSLSKYSIGDSTDLDRGLSNTASNVTEEDALLRLCATPTLFATESQESVACRLVSTSSRGVGSAVTINGPPQIAGDTRSVRSTAAKVHESQNAEYSICESPITHELVVTVAQGSVAFLSGEHQLLRVLVSRLLLSQATRPMFESQGQCNEGKSKITTCANVTDFMLMTCSPLITDSGLMTPDAKGLPGSQTNASQTLVPLVAPLSDHDPLFSLMMTHHLYRYQRRTKSVGRRKRFISSLMGGGGGGGGMSSGAVSSKTHDADLSISNLAFTGPAVTRGKRLFNHKEIERINQLTNCCHKYDHIDVKVAPIEVKMAQKLLVAIHEYFSGDPTQVVADKHEGSPKTDLLESLKAVEQHIIQTSQTNPEAEPNPVEESHTQFAPMPAMSVVANVKAPTANQSSPTTVEVAQVRINPIRMLLSYHGLININDCQVSLNAFVLNQVEAPHINAVLKKIGLHIVTSAFAKALSFRVKNIVPRRKNSERKREKFAITRLMPKKRTADDLLAYILDEHKRRKSKWETP